MRVEIYYHQEEPIVTDLPDDFAAKLENQAIFHVYVEDRTNVNGNDEDSIVYHKYEIGDAKLLLTNEGNKYKPVLRLRATDRNVIAKSDFLSPY